MDTQAINENLPQDSNDLKTNGNNGKYPFSLFSTNWKINIVDNENAPELFSRKAIYFFTVFCSVLFGGILLVLNLRKLKNKQGQIVVAIYSILYFVITTSILAQFQRNTIITFLVSMLGSFPLYNYFWGKYIGIKTEYKAKPIWIPLIIALVILALLLIVALSNIESFK